MDRMTHYILGAIYSSELAVKALGKTVKRQQSFNRVTVFVIGLLTANVIIKEHEIRYIRGKVDELESEIKKLGRMEGD